MHVIVFFIGNGARYVFFSDNNSKQQLSESHFIDTKKTDNVTVDVCTFKENLITC